MVQKSIDSKFSEYGHGNFGKDVPSQEKQLQISAKKTASRDLQNDNMAIASNCTGSSPLLKEIGTGSDIIKVSGNKRALPVYPASPSHLHSSTSNSANGHLVYVRRKSDADIGKNSSCDNTSIKANYPNLNKLGSLAVTVHLKSQAKELQNHCVQAFAPFPMVSSVNAPRKPSVPHHMGKCGINLAVAESNFHSAPSTFPSVGIPVGWKNLQWEDRYHQLQLLLNKLDQSDQRDYLQVLGSLSSVELSRHAVELEKRSIQLSLEEVLDLDISNIQRLDNLVINSLKITRERFTLAPEVSNLLHSGLLLGHVSEKSSNRQMQNWSQQHRNWRRRKLSCR
ncbi:uncharacterized protein LOC101211824 isoform X2 [Cucumis sativus]|uniref:uncharacterized protein LOC101211824 isoform X2 n=1 Tax=Cucumis sativus TaxID=3659 RepID=UPI0012F4924F|nr:uncharacterized protein LOC101211824 isoform X2 [Cucumis sativus]